MEFKIINKKNNPMMGREEIQASIIADDSTPSRKTILTEASKALGLSEDLLIVEKITTQRSKKESAIRLFVYKKKEDIPSSKTEKMEVRITGKKPSSAGAQKQETPAK